MPVESRPDLRGTADDPSWNRFHEEIFSLRVCIDAAPEPLVSKLAAEGVEMIVDARSGNAEPPGMAADCEGVGVYYVPALGNDCKLGTSANAAARYAKLAMRHKTCFLVDDHSDELLRLVSQQIPFTAVPLDDEPDPAHLTSRARQTPTPVRYGSGAERSAAPCRLWPSP